MTVRTGPRSSLRHLVLILLVAVAASRAVADDNLGQRIVRGRVYNLDRGEGVPIASATISFRNLQGTGPDASGLAVSDVNGNFAFSLVLHSSDIVRLTTSAPGFEAFTTSDRADQLVGRNPAIEIGLGEASPGFHRVRGHLAMGASCATDAPNVQVRLRRSGQMTRSGTNGTFHFDGIADGDYILRVGRLDLELPVTVAGQDQEIMFCLDCPELPTLSLESGHPGISVRVSTPECSALQPPQPLTIYFDDTLVASTQTGVLGTFAVDFPVPLDATVGPHRVRVFTEETAEIASTQFEVDAACPGDCDRNGEVTINELLRGVALALGTTVLPCPAYGSAPVTIDQLITAVGRALSGCDQSD
ncbi:MAG TPA: carboxypeptidase-like regulatory domain-containing protein [Candidatus Dormibacteraeota bacterium]|nr:carboxypeptidase-like regulatory domain-containing protein [Candidatus Dormibacteraeota bacterium]